MRPRPQGPTQAHAASLASRVCFQGVLMGGPSASSRAPGLCSDNLRPTPGQSPGNCARYGDDGKLVLQMLCDTGASRGRMSAV